MHLPAIRAQRSQWSARPVRPRPTKGKASSRSQASKGHNLGFVIEVDGVLCETTPITACVAWATAHRLWPDVVCGTPQLYARYLRQIMPAVDGLSEAVLLIRILVEEGVIGKLLACDVGNDI